MGIYDRDYYQNSRGGFLGTIASTGQVVKWLIIVNIAMFALQMFTMPRMPRVAYGPVTEWLLLDTRAVTQYGQVWRLLTYSFLHSEEIFHILFNMLFLWWFGRDIEAIYGSKEFLTFYLVSAFLGGVAFTLLGGGFYLAGENPFGQQTLRCVGASGAVMAVMLLYACHFPQRTILLFFILPVPVWLFVGFQVFQDAFWFAQRLGPNAVRTQTAVTVHLAGALFGFLYYRNGWRLSPLVSMLRLPNFGRPRPRLRVYREERFEEERVPVAAGPMVDEQLEAKLDAVLEKIQTHGKESLTPNEQELLQRASEVYKRRRSLD